jgi:hypothetical protein
VIDFSVFKNNERKRFCQKLEFELRKFLNEGSKFCRAQNERKEPLQNARINIKEIKSS